MAQEKKDEAKNVFPTILKLILGLAFLVLGVWAIIVWRQDLFTLIKGCIGGFLVLAGVITLAIAKN